YLELPKVGKVLKAGDEFGIIESVKSTSPIYSPVAGEVVERNELLLEDKAKRRDADLSLVNDDPVGRGGMGKSRLGPRATPHPRPPADEGSVRTAARVRRTLARLRREIRSTKFEIRKKTKNPNQAE